MSVFARFNQRLQHAIVARLGWSSLRPVQELAGEAMLAGQNAVVLAPTAAGKTEAAIFPLISQLIEQPPTAVGALYVAPLKALLNNQADRLGVYTEMVGMRRFVWHGDTKAAEKAAFLREPAEVLMTTPESLEVMLVSPRVATSALFADLRFVVVDEVHALAGTDRGAHLMSVLERVARLSRHDLQRVGLSATVGNPEAIARWLSGSSARPSVVVQAPKVASQREFLIVCRDHMRELARDASKLAKGKKSLLFCQSRSVSEEVAERMRGAGTDVYVHHSSVSREERLQAEEQFHRGTDACIVCTSTLELGIDVGDLDRVLQIDAPPTVSSFLQRMGRTGRRPGQVANTTFLCGDDVLVPQAVALIELARAGFVESTPIQTRCWPVLVHQLLAMALGAGSISRAHAWEVLSRVPDFSGIAEDEHRDVINHMVRTEYLFEADGLLSLGEEAERVYGRKNFMKLYAVFSSPAYFTVMTATGREVGSLEQAFVDRLLGKVNTFLLGGRAWLVRHVDFKDRRVLVEPAPRGKKPSWGGFLPQFLGFDVCQRIRQVVTEDVAYPYLHATAAAALSETRALYGELLRRPGDPLEFEPGRALWWTFAGGRINFTLSAALGAVTGWSAGYENMAVTIDDDGVDTATFADAMRRLRAPGFWEDEAVWGPIRGGLPEYRLSKFQQALPNWAQREMLEAFLLDIPGTRRFVGET